MRGAVGIVAICTAAVTVSCGGAGTASTGSSTTASDGIPRISRVPMTTPTRPADPDAAFAEATASLPISATDGRLLAISTCMAFRQNPGTTYSSAVDQLANVQAWTEAQTRVFLRAAVEAYCPEFLGGS